MDNWLLVLLVSLTGGFIGVGFLIYLSFYVIPQFILAIFFNTGRYRNHSSIPKAIFLKILYGIVYIFIEFTLLLISLLMIFEIINKLMSFLK